ncbi:MAG: HlyD family secretion protein [Gammaproteobacteria bacterium]
MINLNEVKNLLKKQGSSAHFKKRLIMISLILSTLFILWYWIYSQFHVSTDDAYVNADIVQIAPQVTGRVLKVYVDNNQFVKKGQPLFEIDSQPYEIAVDRAQAQLALARQNVSEKSAAVTASEALVAVRQAELSVAKSTAERTMKLVKRHVLSQQAGDNTTAAYQSAAAALDAAKANLDQARITLGKTTDDNEQVRLAKANLRDAELNLSYTHIVAPSDGIIANLSLRAGTIIAANQPLFALINNGEYWVDTNLKETDLKNIKPGQKADIHIDMYPGHRFKGVVVSISGGSGTAFSLLPPQNATGNWVKVTQRVPVRVRVVNMDPQHPLRIGTSANVQIRT